MSNERRNVMVQGRIVWVSGDLFAGQIKKDHQTKQPILDKMNNPVVEYGFGLAVPKTSLTQKPDEIWGAINAEALSLFPGGHIPPDFSMKYKDGDSDIDNTGKPYSARTGYAGHLVFACTTRIPIKYFKLEGNQNFQINEGIKCGDYVNVQLGVKAHPAVGQGKAGIYLNPNAVQLLGYGEAIVNAPSGDQIFGTTAMALPSGASATPTAPAGMIVPPGAPAQPAAPQPAPAPVAAPAPHYGVLPTAQQPQAAPAMAPAPVAPTMPQPGMPPQAMAQPAGVPTVPVTPAAAPGYPPQMPGIPQ